MILLNNDYLYYILYNYKNIHSKTNETIYYGISCILNGTSSNL